MDFYQNSVPSIIKEVSDGQVEFDTSKMSIVCHSSGCQVSKEFAIDDASRVQAFQFIDPVFQFDKEYLADDEVFMVNEGQTVVVAASELCQRCCTKFYANWNERVFDSFQVENLKTYQVLAGQGHCSPTGYKTWIFDNLK